MKHFVRAGAALALAALACGARAQAANENNVYGLFDLAVGAVKPRGGVSDKGVESGNMSTSYLGLRGVEDLGGGLSTVFALESFLRANNGAVGRYDGDTFWSRNAYAGFSGAFGSTTLGRNTTPLYVSTLTFNAFGDSYGYSPSIRHYFSSGTVTGDSGWNSSMLFTSPVGDNGLRISMAVAAHQGGEGRKFGGNLLYAKGPVGASFAWQAVKSGPTQNGTGTWQLAGSYDFTLAKLYAQYGEVKNGDTGNKYKLFDLSASVPLGAGRLLGAYGHMSPAVGNKLVTYSLGYDYDLSKRTDAYAAVMSDKQDTLSSGNAYSLGLRHRF
ncbi:MAG TPA: porin [Methylibium sp.]